MNRPRAVLSRAFAWAIAASSGVETMEPKSSEPTSPGGAPNARVDLAKAGDFAPLLYAELRSLAGAFMRSQSPGHTLQPTALVNEAYIKMVGGERKSWDGREHFLAVAAMGFVACSLGGVLLVAVARRRGWLAPAAARSGHHDCWSARGGAELGALARRFSRRRRGRLRMLAAGLARPPPGLPGEAASSAGAPKRSSRSSRRRVGWASRPASFSLLTRSRLKR
jgi:hypothetical protein